MIVAEGNSDKNSYNLEVAVNMMFVLRVIEIQGNALCITGLYIGAMKVKIKNN